jgi:hypothetical protein
MAERSDFTQDEWNTLCQGPHAAVSAVIAADVPDSGSTLGGLFWLVQEMAGAADGIQAVQRETAWPPVVAEMIRDAHGDGATPDRRFRRLARPERADHPLGYGQQLASAAGRIATRLSPDELGSYVEWVLTVGEGAARAVWEDRTTTPISAREAAALADIEHRLRHAGEALHD